MFGEAWLVTNQRRVCRTLGWAVFQTWAASTPESETESLERSRPVLLSFSRRYILGVIRLFVPPFWALANHVWDLQSSYIICCCSVSESTEMLEMVPDIVQCGSRWVSLVKNNISPIWNAIVPLEHRQWTSLMMSGKAQQKRRKFHDQYNRDGWWKKMCRRSSFLRWRDCWPLPSSAWAGQLVHRKTGEWSQRIGPACLACCEGKVCGDQ